MGRGWSGGYATHLLAAHAVLPLLEPGGGEAALLGEDSLLLLERRAQGLCGNRGVLVVPVSRSHGQRYGGVAGVRGTNVKRDRQAVMVVEI